MHWRLHACIRSLWLALSLLLFVSTPALQASDSDPAAPHASSESAATLDGALASVNGVLITRERFDAEFVHAAAISDAADPDALAFDVLNRMINDELILQFAEANDIAVPAESVDAIIAGYRANADAAVWAAWLADNQFSAEALWNAVHLHLATLAVREHVTAHLQDAAPHVRARHILVASQGDAELAIERLRSGLSFGALAAALSLDVSTRDFGGDLGWFVRGELLDPRLGDAAFSQAMGEIGGPIATRLGYHVLQVTGRARRGIEAGRMPYIRENVFNLWLEDQLEAAAIRFNLAALHSLSEASS